MNITPRNKRTQHSNGRYAPTDWGYAPNAVTDPYVALFGDSPNVHSSIMPAGTHPLFDATHNRRLLERASHITAAFDALEPALKEVAVIQSQDGFADRAQSLIMNRLGFNLPSAELRSTWVAPLNMRGLYAYSAFQTFLALAQREFDRNPSSHTDDEPAEELIRKWGFHAIDISPCADGRLSGVVDYILRIPPVVVANRKSFAGAMFDVEESMRNWVEIELRRHREGTPNPASEPTRYLKIGVYHTSSSDPAHEGCAAHGSDERKAAQMLLDRLVDFGKAIENSHCCGASVATLLIGVDTDTDSIKLHVPDARGEMSLDRYIDNDRLFDATRALGRESAKEAIRSAVADAAGLAPDDTASEGMRWFCGYLLKNNMAQIEYVRAYHNGRYTDLCHTERFVTVGDSFDDVQLRNLAYQAQMETVEEGAADMDVGIKIFKKVNMSRGLPIPVFVHFRYDGRVPGSRERSVLRAERLARAIQARYPDLVEGGWLYLYATIKDCKPGSCLETIEAAASNKQCDCGCNKAGSMQ